LPPEAKGEIAADRRDLGEEIEFEEEMDEESKFKSTFYRTWFLGLLTDAH